MIAQPATWCLPVSQPWLHPYPQCWNHRCERHPSWWGPLPVLLSRTSRFCLDDVNHSVTCHDREISTELSASSFPTDISNFFKINGYSWFFPPDTQQKHPVTFHPEDELWNRYHSRMLFLQQYFHVFILLQLSKICINGETWKHAGKVRQEDSALGEVIH